MKKIFTLLFFVAALNSVIGQTTTSSIKGTVKGSNSESLPGATILAVHTPTGTRYSALSNEDGRYNIMNMRIGGPYKIVVTFVGFKTEGFNDVNLELGKPFIIDIKMQDDSQKLEEVKVTASGNKVFKSGRTGAETNIGKKELASLPSITRSASDFTRLEPTASSGSFGGRNDQFNNYSLNGAIFNNPFGLDAATPGGQTDAQPISLDAIDQIQVATAPYDVTLSGFTGASVNAVTKSGSNEFHGTAYGFFRNESLTGDKIKGEKIYVPSLEQSQAGFSIGGPIIKDKLFFFANYEVDQRSDLGASIVANDGNGTTGVNESRVLATDLIAVSNALAGLGYKTGSYQGFTHDSNSNKGIIKLDWNINDNHKLAVIYNFLDASKEKPAHPTAIYRRGPDANTMQFENSGYQMNNKLNSFLVELNSKLSETTTNQLQAGYTHFNDFRNPFSAPAPVITITKDGSPYIIAGHEPFSIHNRLDQKVLQLTNNLNIVKGDHTFTMGFSFEKFMFKNSFNLKGYGFGVFGSTDMTGFNANIANGSYAADLAAAKATFDAKNKLEPGTDGGWNLAELNVGQLAFYAQDEWNVNDNFKVTFGLRADKPLFFNTSDLVKKFIDTDNSEGNLPNIDYYDPNNGLKVKHFDSTKMPNNDILWSPRVGFNWNINGENISQLRGGTGIFTGKFPFVWIGNQVGGIDPFFHQVVDENFKFPQVWRTSMGYDHKFENDLILTVDMSYNKDMNAVHVQDWGLKTPTSKLVGVDSRPIYGANDHGVWTDYGFPVQSHAYTMTNSDKGSTFNTTLRVQKTFDNGFYTSLAYNYMVAKDVNSIEAEITGDAFNFNPALNNVNDDVLANSKYGDKNRFIGVTSKKWKYSNDKWATTVSTVFEYKQGGRFSYTYGGDINGDGSGANDLIYIPTSAQIASMSFSGSGQGAAYNNYIAQDDYLSGRRGHYDERYGALSPWVGRWDMKIMQDYNFKLSSGSEKKNTIQFSIDILNFGNLLNSDWGLVQVPVSVQPIGVSVTNNVPTYTFNGAQTKTFAYDSSLASRWQMQFGIRYIF